MGGMKAWSGGGMRTESSAHGRVPRTGARCYLFVLRDLARNSMASVHTVVTFVEPERICSNGGACHGTIPTLTWPRCAPARLAHGQLR